MSTLTENLQTIYTVKQQLKQAIGTSSDIFEDYPSYVANMVTPTGYTYVTANGDYNVSTYQMVNVNVSGGVTPTGNLFVMTPGQYDAASYAYVAVCKDCTDNYDDGLLNESVGTYIGMEHVETADNSEAICTLTAEIATEFGTAFSVNLTPYVGSNYVMFGDDRYAEGEVYGILIDTNSAFTTAGYPSPSSQTTVYLQFDMLGELKWKNANAGIGDVSSLVIGQASNIAVLNS